MYPISPRSGNYERLEGGLGPSRMNRKFAWKKLAIGTAVLIGLVYFFGPRVDVPELPTPGLEDVYVPPPIMPDTTGKPSEPTQDPVTEPVEPPSTRPTSPATDPDPLKTVHCTTPFKAGSPIVQYALMIDAGSTGSRIHIYKFNNCGSSPSYEYEVFKMTQPGLSSDDYKGHPEAAAKSLDVLLDEALHVVPEQLRSCTPVAVKATAGLRLLGSERSTAILDAVRQRLIETYPFPIPDTDAVVIMDGKDEGVYAWITANYLLDTIRADTAPGTPTYAVLDLGGASTQIVFEPQFDDGLPDAALEEGEHKYDLKFGGQARVLYQHSYLGYGLMRARASVHRVVDFMSTLRTGRTGTEPVAVGNPCLAQGTQKVVDIEDGSEESKSVLMTGGDIGSFEACNRVLELVMAKDAVCELKPCSFDGVYQPSLLDSFPTGKVLLLSYFYDRVTPLISMQLQSQSPLTVSTIANIATDVCRGRTAWEKRWGDNSEAMDELDGRPEWCLDLTFMHALLKLGYEFGDTREVALGKQIDGTELGWCLGATIAMVGGELKCRV